MENTDSITPEQTIPVAPQGTEAKPSVVLTTSVEPQTELSVTAPVLPDPSGEPVLDPSALPILHNDWKWDEALVGQGDRPEWLETKFTSVAEQAKGYKELQKQFQQRQAENAPEEYEIEISPEMQDSGFDVALESPVFKEFEAYAKEKGFPNDTFNELTNRYLSAIQDIHRPLSDEERQVHIKEEMDKLGADGPEIVTRVTQWGKTNLNDDDYAAWGEICDCARYIKVMKAVLDKNIPTAASQQQSVMPKYTRDDLKKMKQDPKYSYDTAYQKAIDAEYIKLANAGELGNRAGGIRGSRADQLGDFGK